MITLIILLCLVELLVLTSLVHTEHEFWGLLSLVVAAGCYKLIAGIDPFINLWHNIIADPTRTGLIVLAYLLIGIGWSFFKYYSYVKGEKRKGTSKESLQRENNTGRAIGWMAYWPISMLAHVVGNGIYNFFLWIYNQIKGGYEKILDKVYA